jgi:polar amino acid transport system substrate-binding protein
MSGSAGVRHGFRRNGRDARRGPGNKRARHDFEAREVIIGIDLGAPPFSFLDDKKEATGSDVETARMLAKDLGVTLEITPITSANRIPYLLTNRVDLVMSTFSILPERAKSITFSTPYGVNNSVIFAPQEVTIKTAADLAGKSVGVARGTGNETFLAKIAPSGMKIICFNDEASAQAALAAGQVDAYASDETIAKALNSGFPEKKFETKFFLESSGDFYSIGLKHGDPDLLRWVNTFLFYHRENGDLATMKNTSAARPAANSLKAAPIAREAQADAPFESA